MIITLKLQNYFDFEEKVFSEVYYVIQKTETYFFLFSVQNINHAMQIRLEICTPIMR